MVQSKVRVAGIFLRTLSNCFERRRDFNRFMGEKFEFILKEFFGDVQCAMIPRMVSTVPYLLE